MRVGRRSLLAAGLLAPVAARAQATALKPHTLEELLKAPTVRDAAISPDGELLAVLQEQEKGDKRTALVLINRLEALEEKPLIVTVGEFSVEQVEWAKNDRLLIWVSIWKDNHGREYGVKYGDVLIPIPLRRVISVGLRGAEPVILFADQKTVMRRSFNVATVVDLMPHDPRLVVMQALDPLRSAFNLYQVDVYTGAASVVEKGSSATDGWVTQRGVPMLRIDSNPRGTVVSVLARAPGETEWKLVRKSRRDELSRLTDLEFVGPTAEAGVFYVAHRGQDQDKKSIQTFDVRTHGFGPPIGDPPPNDVEGVFLDDALKLVAIGWRADRIDYRFSEPALAADYRLVNRALKDRCNVRLFDLSRDHNRMLLKVSGPQEPGAFYFFDRKAKRLHLIATMKPWLQPERLAAMETLRVRTRDGAEITAYLSAPAGAGTGPLPMVVMPHGGPEVRDGYDYDEWAQALAARGWLVLQPNFRGSGGYGKAFARLGYRRWADRMQEDVEDAVAQVVASGRADAARLAILGASYGGYAALFGAVRKPDLYRAVVSINGVTDLSDLVRFEREDGEDSPTFAYVREMIGDPKTDADLLKTASPRFRAGEIKAPVLLMHGTADAVVPDRQSEYMAAALRSAGKRVEHVRLTGEGHSGWSEPTTRRVLDKACAFIAAAF